jgi:hypothetical protein
VRITQAYLLKQHVSITLRDLRAIYPVETGPIRVISAQIEARVAPSALKSLIPIGHERGTELALSASTEERALSAGRTTEHA